MNSLKRTLRFGAAAVISAALVAASVVPAQAAPRDNKNDLISAAATLSSQANTALSISGGSNTSCKLWNANQAYSTGAMNSINTIRGLAGVTALTSNATLNKYTSEQVHSQCSYPASPGFAIGSIGYQLVSGDPGSYRKELNADSYGRTRLLSTSAKYASIGVYKSAYSNVAREYSNVASASSGDYLTTFNKNVAWPNAGFFPVELSNGVWSYFAKNTDYKVDPNLSNATVTVKNSAGKALSVEKLTTGGWSSGSEEIHFKVPGATVGTTKSNEASYTVTISGVKKGYTSTALPNITYTVKLVRTGASFKYNNVAPKITKQPATKLSVKVNKYINVSAGVFVPNQQEAELQWEYKRKGESKWNTIWGADASSASITPQGLSLNGSLVRLKVESAGKTVYTNNITLKVTKYASSVKISKATLKRGKKPVVTVKASQAGKVKITATKGKTKITKTVSVKKNKSTKVTLSKAISKKSSAKGKWKVTAKFTPSKSTLYAASSKSLTVKVK